MYDYCLYKIYLYRYIFISTNYKLKNKQLPLLAYNHQIVGAVVDDGKLIVVENQYLKDVSYKKEL